MAAITQRLQCAQLPGVSIVSVGSDPEVYFAHMQQLIGYLQQKTSRRSANSSMHTYLKSEPGKRMLHGGDLASAYIAGKLDAMVFTHSIGMCSTKPSNFLSMDGVRYVMETLPCQDESARKLLDGLLQDHLLDHTGAGSCFLPVLDDGQFLESDDDEVDGVVVGEDGLVVVPAVKWFRSRLSTCEAENRVLKASLKGRDDLLRANATAAEAEKQAAILKKELECRAQLDRVKDENAIRDKADAVAIAVSNRELQHMKELMELRVQLARAQRSPRSDDESSSPAKKTAKTGDAAGDGEPSPPAKKSAKKSVPDQSSLRGMLGTDIVFTKLISADWANTIAAVNSFVMLQDDTSEFVVGPSGSSYPDLMPRLVCDETRGVRAF